MVASDERSVAAAMLQSAKERFGDGQLDAAAALAERARDLFAGDEAFADALEAARVAATARARRGDIGGARALLEWCCVEGAKRDMPAEVAQARTELGGLAELTSDFRQALVEHQAARTAAATCGRDDLHAVSLGNVGRLRQRTGELEAAEHDLIAARALFLQAGISTGAVNASICLGDLYRQRGDLQRARDAFDGASREARAIGHPRLHALAALNLGHAARDLGERDVAVGAFRSALKLGEGQRDPFVSCGARLGLGLVLADTGPIDAALEQLQLAELGFAEIGNLATAAAASVNAAGLHCRLGDFDEGQRRMQFALQVLESVGDQRGQVEVGLALAEVALMTVGSGEAQRICDALGDAERHGARIGRRLRLIEARIELRALHFEGAEATLVRCQGPELTLQEQHMLRQAGLEHALLRGQRGVLDEAIALLDSHDGRSAKRDLAASHATVAGVALWLGALELAGHHFGKAEHLWRRMGEVVGLAIALDGKTRTALLAGEQMEVGELARLEERLRTGGAVELADTLALTLALARALELGHERPRRGHAGEGGGFDPAGEIGGHGPLLLAHARRGNRLALWSELHWIAHLLDDEDAADEADAMATGSPLVAPRWRLSPSRP